MNTNTTTIRLFALAAIATSLIAPSAVLADTAVAAPQTAVVSGVTVPVAHMGPGVGSVKTPPFTWLSKAPKVNQSPLSFHVTGNATTTAPAQHVGPGIGSVKSPAVR